MTERDINQRVAEQILESSSFNGRQFHQGEWVALIDGSVVAVTDTLGNAVRALRNLDANPQRGMVFEFGPIVTNVIR